MISGTGAAILRVALGCDSGAATPPGWRNHFVVDGTADRVAEARSLEARGFAVRVAAFPSGNQLWRATAAGCLAVGVDPEQTIGVPK